MGSGKRMAPSAAESISGKRITPGTTESISEKAPMTTEDSANSKVGTEGIRLENVTFGYASQPLFRDFSLKLSSGKITSIIGPNGCGKSTLLKLISGACKPSKGTVRVCGHDIAKLGSKERARVMSLMVQEHTAPPVNVRQLVEFGRYPHHGAFSKLGQEDHDAVERALEATRLSPLAGANVNELSGGQRQRAFIAMALAQDTQVVLLDEPTSFLDISANYDVMELMRSLKSEHGKTVVAVIHDINLALKYSDEVCVLRDGELLAQGAPQEPQVLKGIELAFNVRVELMHSELGSIYALFKAR